MHQGGRACTTPVHLPVGSMPFQWVNADTPLLLLLLLLLLAHCWLPVMHWAACMHVQALLSA